VVVVVRRCRQALLWCVVVGSFRHTSVVKLALVVSIFMKFAGFLVLGNIEVVSFSNHELVQELLNAPQGFRGLVSRYACVCV
jgi:hypothetical protein